MKSILLLSQLTFLLPTGYAAQPITVLNAQQPSSEVIVRFHDNVTQNQKEQLHQSLRAVEDQTRKLLPQMDLVKVPDHSINALLEKYRNSPLVAYAEPNHKTRRGIILPQTKSSSVEKQNPFLFSFKTNLPTDPYLNRQWSITGNHNINLLETWDTFRGSHDIVVGVVDTGLAIRHEDIQDNLWKNEGEIANNGIDDDGNGYVDDVYGYDMIDKSPLAGDGHGHGSHVSGVIAASTNNRTGISGINWNARVMGVRAVPNWSDETDADVIEAFLYAADNGARVVNCSFGKSESGQAVAETMRSLSNQVLFVLAAGNDGKDIDRTPTYPASFDVDNAITVAALKQDGKRVYFSNYGKEGVDIGAPGVDIWSLTAQNYAAWSGTSMAAPHVAGAAALVLSAFPDLTPIELKEILMESGTPNSTLRNVTVSGKELNIGNAISMAYSRSLQKK